MVAVLEKLLFRSSISDILQYIFLEKRTAKKEIEPESKLEKIAASVIAKKTAEKSGKRKVIEEIVSSEVLVEEKVKVSYELFIPAVIEYEMARLKYSQKDGKEEIEVDLKDEFGLKLEKPDNEQEKYSVTFVYDKERQGYKVKYETDYKGKLDLARQDFTNRLDKSLSLLPKSLMGGILGFTYLGSGKMTRRDDLFGDMALLVDVHEAIHTPNEYETRVLTDWILRRERPKYRM